MMNIKLATENRKAVAERLAEITGAKILYTRAPRFAYEIGGYTIERELSVTVDEGADLQPLRILAGEGMLENFEEPAAEPEQINLTVEVPMASHTGSSVRNLINLLYTRASLINKALGTNFRIDEGLTKALADEASIVTKESLLAAIATYEDEHGKAIDGLTLTPERIIFRGLPETNDTDTMRTFTILCGMMNKQALEQKRIQAKTVNAENEKYALRIWLTRLGMNGPDYKDARRILLAKLTGHCAFRTDADREHWQQRQAGRREAIKTIE